MAGYSDPGGFTIFGDRERGERAQGPGRGAAAPPGRRDRAGHPSQLRHEPGDDRRPGDRRRRWSAAAWRAARRLQPLLGDPPARPACPARMLAGLGLRLQRYTTCPESATAGSSASAPSMLGVAQASGLSSTSGYDPPLSRRRRISPSGRLAKSRAELGDPEMAGLEHGRPGGRQVDTATVAGRGVADALSDREAAGDRARSTWISWSAGWPPALMQKRRPQRGGATAGRADWACRTAATSSLWITLWISVVFCGKV